MSNTYYNNLTIHALNEGATEWMIPDVLNFIRRHDDLFSFSKIIPYPESPEKGWMYKNWGCKWDHDGVIIEHVNSRMVNLTFDTANGFPDLVITEVARMFPFLDFELHIISWSDECRHRLTWTNGKPRIAFIATSYEDQLDFENDDNDYENLVHE